MALEDGLTVDLLAEVVSISTGGVTSSENVASSSSSKVDVTVDFLETFFFFDDLISALSAISLIACIKRIIGGDVRS